MGADVFVAPAGAERIGGGNASAFCARREHERQGEESLNKSRRPLPVLLPTVAVQVAELVPVVAGDALE